MYEYHHPPMPNTLVDCWRSTRLTGCVPFTGAMGQIWTTEVGVT